MSGKRIVRGPGLRGVPGAPGPKGDVTPAALAAKAAAEQAAALAALRAGQATAAVAEVAEVAETVQTGRLSEGALADTIESGVAPAIAAEQARADAAYARAGAIVRPVLTRTKPANSNATAGGGTAAGAGTITLADTADFAFASSAVKLTSAGAGSFRLYKFPGTFTWDLTTAELRVLIKVPDWTNINELYVRASSDGGTGYRQWNINEGPSSAGKRILRPGEWVWLDLPRADATTVVGTVDWTMINDVRVFFTDKNGQPATVQVNAIERVPLSGLPNGAVIFTFDDLHISHWTMAKAKLDSVGSPGVAFPIIGNAGSGNMSVEQMRLLRDFSGWEIGAHAYDNAEHAAGFAGKTESQLRTIFDRLKTMNAINGFGSDALAWPNGDSDSLAQTVARAYFSTARGTTNGTQSQAYDNLMNTRAWGISSAASAQGYIDRAKASRGVAQFVMHAIVESGGTGLDTLRSNFEATVDYAVAQGVPIMTTQQVLKALGKL